MRYQSYIICTSPRSGSTLLCKLLEATGVCGVPDSHFHAPSLSGWLSSHGLSGDHYADERAGVSAVFDAARRAGTGDTGMFGLRLQQHSLDHFLEKLRLLFPEPSTDLDRLRAAFGPVLFVYLRREDKLAQAVSRLLAEQTGLWHRAADGTELERLSAPHTPVYDAAALARHVADLTAADAAWECWFEHEGVVPLRITYEALARDPVDTLSGLLGALDLDRAVAQGLTPPTARLANDISRSWTERFRAETGR